MGYYVLLSFEVVVYIKPLSVFLISGDGLLVSQGAFILAWVFKFLLLLYFFFLGILKDFGEHQNIFTRTFGMLCIVISAMRITWFWQPLVRMLLDTNKICYYFLMKSS